MRTTFLLFVPAVMASDDWKTLWWLPSDGEVTPGKQVASHNTMPHLMFVPAGTPPADGWPLLVFLHGQGESSPTPLPRVAIQGPPQTCGRAPGTMKMAVLSPQKPMSSQFYDNDVADNIEALVDMYVASHKLDVRRVYLTGLSQGSIGTWNLAAARPAKWAAIAPVSLAHAADAGWGSKKTELVNWREQASDQLANLADRGENAARMVRALTSEEA